MPARVHFPEALAGRYDPLEELGSGGFGVVFRARDRDLDREVAVKVLTRELSAGVRARFVREARLLARLEHPNVLRLFDFDADAVPPFLVTELLVGRAASEGRVEDPARVMADVARGLAALHDAGLVHRDVKPSNLMVTDVGRGVLLDLGLAIEVGNSTVLTRTGAIVGTPHYLAPELVEGRSATPESDWFAWGASLYELVEGRALRAGIPLEQLVARGFVTPPRFQRIDRRSDLAALIRACLATAPARRPRHLEEVLPVLEAAELPGRSGDLLARSAGPTRTMEEELLGAEGAGSAEAARPAGRARWRVLGAALVLVAVAGLARSLVAEPPPPEAPPLAPVASAVPEGRDLPEGLLDGLEEEVDRALAMRWFRDGTPRGAAAEPAGAETLSSTGSGMGLQDALYLVGMVVRDDLPAERRVLDWVADGGELSALRAPTRRRLEAHDAAFRELGFPVPFGPLLRSPAEGEVAAGAEVTPALQEVVDAVAAIEVGEDAAAAGLRAATAAALARALAARERVEAAHREGRLGPGAGLDPTRHVALLTGSAPEELTVLVGALREGAEGRAALRELLAGGRAATRRALRRAVALLERPGLPAPEAAVDALFRGVWEASGFLIGAMVSADRARLFGPPPTRAAAWDLEARVLHQLALFRARGLLPREPRPPDAAAAWGEGATRALEEGDADRAARLWYRQLGAFDYERDPARFLRAYEARQRALRPRLAPDDRREIESRITRALAALGR